MFVTLEQNEAELTTVTYITETQYPQTHIFNLQAPSL